MRWSTSSSPHPASRLRLQRSHRAHARAAHARWNIGSVWRRLSLFLLLLAPVALAAADATNAWPQLEEVIVVSKTHFDIGYTDLASKVVDRYRTTMADQALKLVDESRELPPNQRFSWTLAGWPMAQVLWPGQTPDRRARFLNAMREGRLVPQALPFTTHTESLDLEDLTRGLQYSVEMARVAGRPLPTDAKMTDVVSHTRATATILAQSGVKFFHIGCNEGCSRPEVPLLYWWEGPDGSRVLTMCSAAYGSSLRPPPGWPHKSWLCMWMTGDNHGPPNAEEVRQLFARAGRELPGVRVRFGQMSDFGDAILQEKPELPVVRGDTPDTWIHGIGSMPVETQLAHVTRPRIAALESLHTVMTAWGLEAGPVAGIVREAYENTLLFGEHTWGPDVARYAGYSYGDDWKKKLEAGDYRFLLEGFAQKRAYAHRAAELVSPALDQRMAKLAAAVNVPGRRVVVFNPLPWTRDAAVEIPWSGPAPVLIDAATAQPALSALAEGRLHVVARNLPALGYRTLIVSGRPAAASPGVSSRGQSIENEFVRITLDPERGGIGSIVSRKTGREWVNTNSPYALGQYLYERFDAEGAARFTRAYVLSPTSGENISHGKPKLPSARERPYQSDSGAAATLEIRTNDVAVTAVLTCPPHGIIRDQTQLRVTLYAGQPRVDLQWSINNKTADPWPEAGWLCFPVRADRPVFRMARLGSVVDPATDLVPGSNHEIFCLNGGLTIRPAGEEAAFGICPIDAQLVSLGKPGLWRYTRQFEPRSSDVFLVLFDNVYSTNFAQWIDGSWASRVRLWLAEDAAAGDESLICNSWEARTDGLAAVTDGAPGSLPATATGLMFTPARSTPGMVGTGGARGLLLTAFGPNPYGPGTVLRFWDQVGKSGDYTIRLPSGMKVTEAQPCNLRGEVIGPAQPVSAQGTFEIGVKAMAPVTVILQ